MSSSEYLKSMEIYAAENDVPIIEKDGLAIVLNILKENNVGSILEIGTAIGYSASKFAIENNCYVTSIERDDNMYTLAVSNVQKLELSQQVRLIHDDALLLDNSVLDTYDCIYIDGAKSQYMKFLEKYIGHLKPGGVVIFDNLLFHGYVFSDSVNEKSRNLKQLIRKLEKFINDISNSEDYVFKLIKQGDGIGVLYRKGENDEN